MTLINPGSGAIFMIALQTRQVVSPSIYVYSEDETHVPSRLYYQQINLWIEIELPSGSIMHLLSWLVQLFPQNKTNHPRQSLELNSQHALTLPTFPMSHFYTVKWSGSLTSKSRIRHPIIETGTSAQTYIIRPHWFALQDASCGSYTKPPSPFQLQL